MLDPFCGSSTTGIAANLLGRRYLGIDQESEFLDISRSRRIELEDEIIVKKYRSKITDIKLMDSSLSQVASDLADYAYMDLPF